MDDEYRAFLESSWNGSLSADAQPGTGGSASPNAPARTCEVVEIEADEEELDEAATASGISAVRELASTRQVGSRLQGALGASRLGACAKAPGATQQQRRPVQQPEAGLPLSSPSASSHPPQHPQLTMLLGAWEDSAGNTIRLFEPTPARPGVLEGELTRKTGKNSSMVKVTRDSRGALRMGAFSLDPSQSSSGRLVWVNARGARAFWERQVRTAAPGSEFPVGPKSDDPVGVGSRAAPSPALGPGRGLPPGVEEGGLLPAEAEAEAEMEARAGAVAPDSGAGAGTGAAGAGSLGARAKTRAAPPKAKEAAGALGIPASAALELGSFLGQWRDSQGCHVQVEPASEDILDVRLTRPGGSMVRLKLTRQQSGQGQGQGQGFKCGHFDLDMARSTTERVLWLDHSGSGRESSWARPQGHSQKRPLELETLETPKSPATNLSRNTPGPGPGPGLRPAPKPKLGPGSFGLAGIRPPPSAAALLAGLGIGHMEAKDAEGRPYDLESVVVNFADVGMCYAKSVLAKSSSPSHAPHDFDWEGVRRCVRYLRAEREMQIFGVVPEDFLAQDSGSGRRCGLPFDVQLMCECVEEAKPYPYAGEPGVAREATWEKAYERNCLYVDSGNGAPPLACHSRCRVWLDKCRDLLHLRYFFDSALGTFDCFDGNVASPALARMNSFS